MSRLKERYQDVIRPQLMEQFSYANVWQAPRLWKVSVNMGVSGAADDRKILDAAAEELSRICGQRPTLTYARRSVANFGVREGQAIGCRATLRGVRMYEFVDRLFSIALPRIRDFRGLSPRAFDGRGNYSIGVREQLIFPELGYDDIERVRGLDITVVTTAKTDEEAGALLSAMGLPLAGA
jgi:large subunit ribosomal protein L5